MLSVKSLKTGALVLGLSLITAVSIAAEQLSGNQAGQPESGIMGNRSADMMGMMGVDTAQMNRMIENCNRIMQSTLQPSPNPSSAPAMPTPGKKG
jgi:hypothetical protein